jgi:hypothetical protein
MGEPHVKEMAVQPFSVMKPQVEVRYGENRLSESQCAVSNLFNWLARRFKDIKVNAQQK